VTGDSPEDIPADHPAEPQESKRRSPPSARNQAMNWLARREYSQAELRARLAERDFTQEQIEVAVAGLVADGLQSDERFAESFVAVRMRKGQGPVRIRMELKRRGLAGELIRRYLDVGSQTWANLASEVRQRKFGANMPDDFSEKARQMRFLEYRGFTGDQIRSAVGDDFD